MRILFAAAIVASVIGSTSPGCGLAQEAERQKQYNLASSQRINAAAIPSRTGKFLTNHVIATEFQSLASYSKFVGAKDTIGCKQLIDDGSVAYVGADTGFRVIAIREEQLNYLRGFWTYCAQVRILSGEHQDELVFVAFSTQNVKWDRDILPEAMLR